MDKNGQMVKENNDSMADRIEEIERRISIGLETEEDILSLLEKVSWMEGDKDGKITALKRRLTRELNLFRKNRIPNVDISILPVPPDLNLRFSKPVGEVNLLMDAIPLTTPIVSDLLKSILFSLVETVGGASPEKFGVYDFLVVRDPKPRLVASWEIGRAPTFNDINGIFGITKAYFKQEIRGGPLSSRGWETVGKYRNARDQAVKNRWAHYFGPDYFIRNSSCGVLIARTFRTNAEFQYLRSTYPNDFMTRGLEGNRPDKFSIELRVAEDNSQYLSQENFLMLCVQISYFLATGNLIDDRALAMRVYKELNSIGAEKASQAKLFGLKEAIETIERVLLLPLQQPSLAQTYNFRPESILLTGVPGVGKTLLAKYLMGGGYNAIFVPVGSDKLLADLSSDKGSAILLQIDKIGASSQLPVVLMIDDIDAVIHKDKQDLMITKLLNILQGVKEKGFYVLASTNHPDRIDSRMLEPGRLSKIVHISLPDFQSRVGILEIHMQGLNVKNKDAVIKYCAKETENWTGRYLEEICKEAGRICSLEILGGKIASQEQLDVRPLTQDHFTQAIKLIRKGVNFKKFEDWDREIQAFISQTGLKIGF